MSEASDARWIVFKQILTGDTLKADAESNKSDTGGGARDLRFPYKPFTAAMNRLFPVVSKKATRNGGEIRSGTVRWFDPAGETHSMPVEYWAPTKARPTEGRIARIPDIPPLAEYPDLDPDAEPLFLLLILDGTGQFIARYQSKSELLHSWHDDVSKPIVGSLSEARAGRAAQGWIDLTNGKYYVHS